MDDLSVIDRFTDVFSRYIDSGFGLLGGEVAFLTSTLVVIDVTLAGLFWAWGGNDDVIAKLIKKIIYVGAFTFIITHFNELAGIIFRSFSGLGLQASGSTLNQADLLHPGRLAAAGVDAGRPILAQISEQSGFPEVFHNLVSITVLFLTWLVLIVSFFVLAVQLFVTLIEFKLTTLAGFVLIPFALWNKTTFLAERVLGNIISSGVKILVLAVIVGIGTNLFAQFQTPPGGEPSIDQALALMLAALALLGLGVFGPSIATGLVSGAPQLGAGVAAGTAIGAAGLAAAGVGAVGGGSRLLARGAGGAMRSATTLASGARAAYAAGVNQTGSSGAPTAAAAVVNTARQSLMGLKARATQWASGNSSKSADSGAGDAAAPAWARRLQRGQRLSQGVSTAAHVVRSADRGGSGANPQLHDNSNS